MVSDCSLVSLVIRESFKGSVWVVQVSAEPGRAAGGTGSWDWTAGRLPLHHPLFPRVLSAHQPSQGFADSETWELAHLLALSGD